MNTTQQQLWQRIESFEFDEAGAQWTFSQRLARENGWSEAFTRRAIDEYRRFVFLSMCAGHPVTPSDEVDQVWHLHLTYTRSYWERLCGEILPRPLHHGPTQGGRDEKLKFHDWYDRTLESYATFFGAPPRDLWPEAARRFDARNRFARVNQRDNWVIRKPRWFGANVVQKRAFAVDKVRCKYLQWASVTLLALFIAGCGKTSNELGIFGFNGPQFLAFYAIFAPIVLVAAHVWRHFWRLPDGEVPRDKLPSDAYHIALLSKGETAVLNGALAEMAQKLWLQIREDGQIVRLTELSGAKNAHPFERAILQTLMNGGQMRSPELLKSLPVSVMLEQMRGVLRAQELFSNQAHTIRAATLALAMLAPLVGIIKIAVGLSRDKPVGYLVIMTLVAFLLACTLWPLPTRTRRGDRALQQLRAQWMHLKAAQNRASAQQTAPLALAIGLYGLEVLPPHNPLRQNLHRSSDSGSSSGGDGGGDSGCGGGG